MMNSKILVSLAGGLAAAILFFGVFGGGVFGVPLLFVSPLPIALLAFGWGLDAAIGGALAGAAIVGLLVAALLGPVAIATSATSAVAVSNFGLVFAVAFLLLVAVPMAIYAYLVLLARHRPGSAGDDADPAPVEWFPLPRVLLVVALGTAGTLILAGWLSGYSVDRFAPEMADVLAPLTGEAVATADPEQLAAARRTLAFLPPTFGLLWTAVMIVNLWLGAVVARRSGRLARPWPDIAMAIDMPLPGFVVFAAALLGIAAPGPIGLAAATLAGALAVVFIAIGFAVLHVTSRDNPARPVLLGVAYAVAILFTLPVFLLALIGIAERFLRLREKKAQSPPRGARPRS